MSKARWNSVWHQLDEVIRLKPESVLEIGPGPGLFKTSATLFGLKVETFDIDPDLNPDHVGSATALQFADDSFDVVCAFQTLEHLPYATALQAFAEMTRVSRGYVVISLPDAKLVWRYLFYLPKIGKFDWLLTRPFARMKKHRFDGQHYWEINKRGYLLKKVIRDLSASAEVFSTYRVKENPYHRFIVARVQSDRQL
jgi:predicted SAM-dependent methyltransferase